MRRREQRGGREGREKRREKRGGRRGRREERKDGRVAGERRKR